MRTAVEIARLRLDLLAVDIAVPRSGIERDIVLDLFEPCCRSLVRPRSVLHNFTVGRLDVEI